MEYDIVQSNRGAMGLVSLMHNWLKGGWKPLGAPFQDSSGMWSQAVTREKR